MAFSDLTPQFRLLVSKSSLPESKRRKTARQDVEDGPGRLLNKEYVNEAYNILKHIIDLNRMLSNIRKSYLSVDTNPSLISRAALHELDFANTDRPWTSIHSLSNEERDQIDLQARIVLSKCSERIRELEELEKRRIEYSSRESGVLMRILPTRLRQTPATITSANLAAHHASITYYLNRRLAEVGQTQKEMQEERIKRQTERARTLGSAVNMDTLGFDHNASSTRMSSSRSWLDDTASNIASSIGLPSPMASATDRKIGGNSTQDEEDEDFDDIELSASQIQQFETENANILQSVQNTLASVQKAESRLMEISALQTELVAHLTKQSEVTEKLYEDAITTTSTVEKGNEQLREARRRAKDGRVYILFFLIMASFSLLFLHYY